MAAKKILTLGKSLKENIDDAYEKFVTGGGKTGKNKKITIQKKDIDKKIAKQKQVSKRAENLAKKQKKTKKVTPTDTPVKELASKAKQKRNIKSKINEAAKKIKKVKKQQSTDLVPTGQSKTIKETVNPKKIKQNFKTVGSPVNKTPKINKPKKQSTALVTIPKNVTTNAGKLAYLKKHFGKNWKRYAAGLGLLTAGFLIPKDKNPSEGKIIGGGNKDKKPPKDFSPKIKKPKTPKVIKKELPKVKSNDYTGRFIDKKGDVAYDSASDFFAHMFGTPKKRKMPKKTARIIGTGDKLKRKDADKKGAGKGVKFKAFKSGTKDKTIGKPMSPKDALNKKFKDKATMYKLIMGMTNKKPTRKRTMVEKIFGGGPDEAYNLKKGQIAQGANKQARKEMKKEYPKLMKRITKKSAGKTVGLKALPPKAENPGIHMLPAKAKMNMGFKPMFGGGFISSLYDKPEKIEKYKGNTTSARQVKGYGKAKKKA
jgi:hypothetical protein